MKVKGIRTVGQAQKFAFFVLFKVFFCQPGLSTGKVFWLRLAKNMKFLISNS